MEENTKGYSKKESAVGKKTKRRSPNRLIVDDSSEVVHGDGDNSCVLLSLMKMEGMSHFTLKWFFLVGFVNYNWFLILQ